MNAPGTTVLLEEGVYTHNGVQWDLIDTPGTYSLLPRGRACPLGSRWPPVSQHGLAVAWSCDVPWGSSAANPRECEEWLVLSMRGGSGAASAPFLDGFFTFLPQGY